MRTTTLLMATLATSSLAACDYLDKATADRPSGTQMEAVGDAFTSIGAFVAVMNDPAAADSGDLADMHATTPYQYIVDPSSAPAAGRRTQRERLPLDEGCITVGETTAAWDCDFTLEGDDCHAMGAGTDLGNNHYSGSSTQTCGDAVVTVTATDVVFDEEAGEADGEIEIEVGDADAVTGWAHADIGTLGFCTNDPTPAPNAGTFTVDGLGELDGKPFDPITIEFSDTPVCGSAYIVD